MTRVLLVEDDLAIAEPLGRVMTHEGWEVTVKDNGRTGLAEALTGGYTVLVLDVGLPGLDGLTVCRRVRAALPDQHIIMLTARAEEVDAVQGLDAGADDYVAKPFRLDELLARIRVAERRAAHPPPVLDAGPIRVDPGSRQAWLAGQTLSLSVKEFDVLALLVQNAGTVVTRAELMKQVWQTTWMGSSRTLDQHISWLRGKLGDDAAAPRYITTVRGIGFRLDAPEGGPAS